MSKSILISIKPKWVAKILNGEKTIEIRKTVPKCDLPIDVYIYCAKNGGNLVYGDDFDGGSFYSHYAITRGYSKKDADRIFGLLNGKVVAKFTLNKVEEINRYCTGRGISYKTETLNNIELCDKSCLDLIEIDHYLYFKKGYAIHISDLEIFEKPKELSEFYITHITIDVGNKIRTPLMYPRRLTKAPQSWCYCESEE